MATLMKLLSFIYFIAPNILLSAKAQYLPFIIAILTSTLYFEEILTSNNKKMKIYLPLFVNSSIKPVDFN